MNTVKNPKKLKRAYINFFEKTRTGKNITVAVDLTHQEEWILMKVALSEIYKTRLSIKDLMNMKDLGSPAWVYAKMKSLESNGWIFMGDTEDSRRKQLKLAPRAFKYFEKMDQILIKCASHNMSKVI